MVEIIPFRWTPIDLGTLGAQIATTVSNPHATGLLASFLAKKLDMTVWLESPDQSDAILVGMARGDATVTEIKTAIENVQLERDGQDQANTRVVLHETMAVLAGAQPSSDGYKVRMRVSLGGGRGIPFERGDGWQFFAYNAGQNDQVAGAFLGGFGTVYGVWLN